MMYAFVTPHVHVVHPRTCHMPDIGTEGAVVRRRAYSRSFGADDPSRDGLGGQRSR
jgi:hypothetical protein